MMIAGGLIALSGVYFLLRKKKELRLSGLGLLVGGIICALWGFLSR